MLFKPTSGQVGEWRRPVRQWFNLWLRRLTSTAEFNDRSKHHLSRWVTRHRRKSHQPRRLLILLPDKHKGHLSTYPWQSKQPEISLCVQIITPPEKLIEKYTRHLKELRSLEKQLDCVFFQLQCEGRAFPSVAADSFCVVINSTKTLELFWSAPQQPHSLHWAV